MRAKKSLGQHFLRSKNALSTILSSAKITSDDVVLEIGPGKGVLTEELLKQAKKVIVVEKDTELVSLLEDAYKKEVEDGSLEIISNDILELSLESIGLKNQGFKVVANIPYYITGVLIRKLLSEDIQPTHMVLLIQKEVAERIARSKKESLLSLSVKAYGTPTYVETVKSSAFSPPPKVDSAILSVANISKDFFAEVSEETFFSVLKAGFKSKRKFLMNNLETLKDKKTLAEIFSTLDLDTKVRAEDVSLEKWRALSIALSNEKNRG